ncbi:AMP-binding protein [Paenibacillus sp. BSR1-1]|uniref:class I adenylate-forming enzyme family protein n=1 Tax=Paenibacillus sp. BSR1-1 TaxID=3020845 RepID=UPI0025AF5B24|nr:AMP-binding protein [Paenibacillus sp. BSR1-1]MDN3016172.1 AMP-binding protein [Paenibacillus sp. BSR1-1]
MNIGNLHSGLAVHARNKPDEEAIVFYEKSRTYKELFERVNALANSLIDLGVKKGDHIALYMRNRLEMVEIYYAISAAGAVGVPINYMVQGESLQTLINNSDAHYLFVEEETLPALEKVYPYLDRITKKTTILVSNGLIETPYISYEIFLSKGSIESPNVEVNSDDVAAMIYSSGTTSLPKGIIITHGNEIFRDHSFAIEWNLNYKDVILITVPIYHSMGHLYIFYISLLGCKIIMTRDFNAENTLRLIQDYKVTHAFFVPTQYIFMLELPSFHQYDLSSLRSVVSAGAPMAEVTKKQVVEKFSKNFTEFYGTSEITPLASLRPIDVLRKPASVGQSPAFMEIRLLNEQGNDVAVGEEGEFAAKGPSMFTKYYKNKEETDKVRTPDGFHRTGDMGRMDKDGFFYLLDRKKDMLISGGVNIYPKDIEEVIYTHPDVLEAAVIGAPDEKWGESVKAYVVLKQGSMVDKGEIITFCNSKLAKYQNIKELEFILALPRNPSGKILKRELRDLSTKIQQINP